MADQTYANTQDRGTAGGTTTGASGSYGQTNVDEGAILRQRIQRLQDDIEGLAHDVNALGRTQAERGREAALHTGRRIENQARENPLASLMITLIGGLIVGLLLGERGRR